MLKTVTLSLGAAFLALVALVSNVRADDNEQCESVTICGLALCPQRLHLAAGLIHFGPAPLDSFQLNLALRPTFPPGRVPLDTEAFSVTLQKTNAPASTPVSISIPAGGLHKVGVTWQFNDGTTTVKFTPRPSNTSANGQWVLNLASSPQPGVAGLTDQDTLALSITLGPDTFIVPFPSGAVKWTKNNNGELVMPLDPCPDTP